MKLFYFSFILVLLQLCGPLKTLWHHYASVYYLLRVVSLVVYRPNSAMDCLSDTGIT